MAYMHQPSFATIQDQRTVLFFRFNKLGTKLWLVTTKMTWHVIYLEGGSQTRVRIPMYKSIQNVYTAAN